MIGLPVPGTRTLADVCVEHGHRGHLNSAAKYQCVVCSVRLCGEPAPGHQQAFCALAPDHDGEHVADWSPAIRWGA